MKLKSGQNGATLVTALVMLIVLTLLVVSGIRSSTTNLRIVGNMQTQEEATAVAQQTIEQVISNNFTAAPAPVPPVPVDINNDTTPDYTASATLPVCNGSTAIPNASLNMNNPADAPCYSSSAAAQTGIIFASGVPSTNGQSWCLAQQWDVSATATSTSGTGGVTAHQGVSVRVPAGTGC